jgi:hypothetical protein
LGRRITYTCVPPRFIRLAHVRVRRPAVAALPRLELPAVDHAGDVITDHLLGDAGPVVSPDVVLLPERVVGLHAFQGNVDQRGVGVVERLFVHLVLIERDDLGHNTHLEGLLGR